MVCSYFESKDQIGTSFQLLNDTKVR
jgi:hypothetical protein